METADNITHLPVKAQPEASPVEFTITHTLPNGRQITARSVYNPAKGMTADAMLKDINGTMDRIRASYEIGVVAGEEDTIDYEIAAHEEAITKATSELAKLDAETDAKISALKNAYADESVKATAQVNADRARAEESGREYDPGKGRHALPMQKLEALQKSTVQDIQKLEEERERGHANHEVNMAVFRQKLEHLKSKREARLKLIGSAST